MTRAGASAAAVALSGPVLAVPAFFHGGIPLWPAGLPLLAGIAIGTPRARAAAMAGWLAVPAWLSAVGMAGVGHDPALVWPGAAAAVLALAVLAAAAGIVPVALAVTLVPFFPASPLVALADTLPGLGFAGLGAAALCLAAVEALPRLRGPCLAAVAAALAAWDAHAPPPPPPAWTEVPEPAGATGGGRRLAVGSLLPEGGAAVLGEAVFREDDAAARDAWCRIAERGDLTLFAGVTESRAGTGRGAVWRLDRETCAPGAPPVAAARAWIGIPGVTGGWLPMPGAVTGGAPGPAFLVCLEAFLPWSWARLSLEGAGTTVAVVSNDRAFGALPVHALRRKAADAMAALTGRAAVHAGTGRTLLTRADGTVPG